MNETRISKRVLDESISIVKYLNNYFFNPLVESFFRALPSCHVTLTTLNIFSVKLTEEINNTNETNFKGP